MEAWFAWHGSKAVFLGRLVPLFRSLISVPAGIDRMPVWPFLGLTLAGSLIWNSVLILAATVAGLVVLFVPGSCGSCGNGGRASGSKPAVIAKGGRGADATRGAG